MTNHKLFVSLDIGDALSLPLYDTSKITYEGAFLVPEGGRDLGGGVIVTGNQYGLQGAGAIAYNPSGDSGNGSLYLSAGLVEGNANEPCLCEISIPVAKTSNYNRASLLQNYELLGGSVGTFPDSGGHLFHRRRHLSQYNSGYDSLSWERHSIV